MKMSTILILAGTMLFAATLQSETGTDGKDQATGKNDNSTINTIKLESIFVGDKEQPAISYFVPWQGVGTPDELHWELEEQNDESLKPVDREIMLRSIQLYEGMNLENSGR
jgi:hypothetical protein